MRRHLIALAATLVFGALAVPAATQATYDDVCVDANPGGWNFMARDFAPAWWDQASQAERRAFVYFVAAQNGPNRTPSSALYANERICVNPNRIPTVPPSTTTTTVAPSTTTTTSTSTSTTSTTSTTVAATTTSTAAPTTTTTTTTAPAPTTTSTVPGACTGAPGTPGSPDGQGGCFPSEASTGPNAPMSSMAAYTGPCTITTATTIDSKVIRCDLVVRAPLTVRNSYIYGHVNGPDAATGPAISISDSIVNGIQANGYAGVNVGVDGPNWTILRTEIVNTNRGAYCQNTCLLQDSYIHGSTLQPVVSNEAHASGMRLEQHGRILHNTIACDYTGPFVNDEIGCSADVSGYADFAPIYDNQLINNLFRANPAGQYYCVYGGATAGKPFSGDARNGTQVVFRDNVFERGSNGKCGTGGPVTDFASGRAGNVWQNNVWSNGGTVPPA